MTEVWVVSESRYETVTLFTELETVRRSVALTHSKMENVTIKESCENPGTVLFEVWRKDELINSFFATLTVINSKPEHF